MQLQLNQLIKDDVFNVTQFISQWNSQEGATQKNVSHYFNLKRTKETIECLQRIQGIEDTELYFQNHGAQKEGVEQGTFIDVSTEAGQRLGYRLSYEYKCIEYSTTGVAVNPQFSQEKVIKELEAKLLASLLH